MRPTPSSLCHEPQTVNKFMEVRGTMYRAVDRSISYQIDSFHQETFSPDQLTFLITNNFYLMSRQNRKLGCDQLQGRILLLCSRKKAGAGISAEDTCYCGMGSLLGPFNGLFSSRAFALTSWLPLPLAIWCLAFVGGWSRPSEKDSVTSLIESQGPSETFPICVISV